MRVLKRTRMTMPKGKRNWWKLSSSPCSFKALLAFNHCAFNYNTMSNSSTEKRVLLNSDDYKRFRQYVPLHKVSSSVPSPRALPVPLPSSLLRFLSLFLCIYNFFRVLSSWDWEWDNGEGTFHVPCPQSATSVSLRSHLFLDLLLSPN